MAQTISRVFSLLVIAASLIYVAACDREKPTSVRITPGPSFALAGSGRLASFTVSAPQLGQKIAVPCNMRLFPCAGVALVAWQIRASKGYEQGAAVQGLQVLYGKIPEGYIQAVPNQLEPAPSLTSGIIYGFSAETTDAPPKSGYFYMSRSGPIQVEVPDLCLTLINGEEVRVKCGTSQPYQEPTNLEQFADEHRATR